MLNWLDWGLDVWRSGFESLLFTTILYLAGWLIVVWAGVQSLKRLIADKPSRWVWALLLLGLLLRLGWIISTQPNPISDYATYWHYAEPLAAGDFTFNNIDKHPGIIILMALSRAVFGDSYWPMWALNLVLSFGVMVMIYLLTHRLFNRTAALIALAFAALQPQLITYSALLASELPTLYLYLSLIWMTLETRFAEPQKMMPWFVLGATLYVAVLTRSTALAFGLLSVMTVILFRHQTWKANLKGLVTFGLTAGLLLSSWVYHQYLLTGKAQLFWGGEIWLVATTHYETESRLVAPRSIPALRQKIDAAIENKTGPQARMAELAEDKKWAMAIFQQNPARYFEGGKIRLRHIFWTTSETGIRDTQWGSARLNSLGHKVIRRMTEASKHTWRFTLILSVLGLILTLFQWKRQSPIAREGLFMIIGFLSIWITFHYLMAVASDRWAVQVIPFALMFAAQTITTVLSGLTNLFPLRKPESPLY